MRFTTKSLTALRAKAAAYWVTDDALPGFRMKVLPSGDKSFAVRIRSRGGRKNRTDTMHVIGHFGTLTVEQARTEAHRLLSQMVLGTDPAAEKRAAREAMTVAELAEQFLADREGKIRPSTLGEYRRQFDVDILPILGNATARDLTRQDVARLHTSKKAKPYLANRLLALLSTMYRWGVERGYLPEGTFPTRGVKPFPEKSRERYLTDGELTRLGEALSQAEKKGIPADPKRAMYHAKRRPKARKAGRPAPLMPANPFAINAIRLLLLTGWREQEVLGLRWDALDLDGGHARLAETKTGLSQRPLGGAAVQLLREMPRLDASPFVFPSRTADQPLTDIKHVWHAVRHAAGLDTIRLHDLRHHFASMGAQQGVSLIALGAVLGHRELATTKKYAHLGDDPTKRAADQISASIAVAMGSGSDGDPEPIPVSPIRRARR